MAISIPNDAIEDSVKALVGLDGPVPTDDELSLACQTLQKANWDYWAASATQLSNRILTIAGAITTYASGNSLVDYCTAKIVEAGLADAMTQAISGYQIENSVKALVGLGRASLHR